MAGPQHNEFLSVVWHTDVPSETRTISELVLRQLGQQGTGGLSKELIAKMEATRESIPPALRGKLLDEFIAKWIADNFDRKQQQIDNGFVSGRFRKGKLAIPPDDYEKLVTRQDKPFASEVEFKQWVGLPCLVDGKFLLRHKEHIRCYNLAAVAKPNEQRYFGSAPGGGAGRRPSGGGPKCSPGPPRRGPRGPPGGPWRMKLWSGVPLYWRGMKGKPSVTK